MRGKCGNAEDLDATAKERKSKAPKPLPKRRPRSLTAPLVQEISDRTPSRGLWNLSKKPIAQHTSDQSLSNLLSRLPKEVRQLIWKEVLGGHWLHIVRAPKRLVAIKCCEVPERGADTRHHSCWGMTINERRLYPAPGFYMGSMAGSEAVTANLLPLLKTCRQM
jgi:hypothetical protein